jgi:hypothetical protein
MKDQSVCLLGIELLAKLICYWITHPKLMNRFIKIQYRRLNEGHYTEIMISEILTEQDTNEPCIILRGTVE